MMMNPNSAASLQNSPALGWIDQVLSRDLLRKDIAGIEFSIEATHKREQLC